jgi:lysophospholipase L1-like esterase
MTVGEVRLAWALLVILAALSYPASSHPGPIVLSAILLAFLLGGLVLSTTTASARITEGLEHLLSDPKGRVSLIGAVLLVILVGFAFNAFVAFALTGLFCSVSWSLDAIFRSKAWEERLTDWTVTGISVFAALAAAEGVLAWEPIARRLGTPAELARWYNRYDRLTRSNSNVFRFRSRYEDTRRRPGVRRVIALGDSFTWGYKIGSADSTWPALLEQQLAQPPDGLPTEVINMAINGFATGNEAEMLRRIGWQFEPDLVIVQWLDNDARVTVPNFGRKEGPPESIVLVPGAYRTGWIRKSGILPLVEQVLTDRFFDYLELRRRLFAQNAPGWLEDQQAFREMGDSAARHCTPILLVLYPFLFPGRWTEETYPERDIYHMVAATGRRAGLEVLDLMPTFAAAGRGRDWKTWWGTAYDGHPGSQAQLVAANAIAAYIQGHRLLADSTRSASRCRP